MASTILGRTVCPECNFSAAHVKRSARADAIAYRFCPDCGAQYFPRSEPAETRLMEKTILIDPADMAARAELNAARKPASKREQSIPQPVAAAPQPAKVSPAGAPVPGLFSSIFQRPQ